MKVSIHQPSYFPWLGLLHKIQQSDRFVLLDTVQLNDAAFQHRNLFLTQSGQVQYLTVPLNKRHYQSKPLAELTFARSNWQKKHLGFIQANYGRHPYFEEVMSEVQPVFLEEFDSLGALLQRVMRLSMQLYAIDTEMVLASELNLSPARKEAGVLEILSKTEAEVYLSGHGAKNYQCDDSFRQKSVAIEYMDFSHPVYPQSHCSQFQPGLACLDMAFNIGLTACRERFHENIGI